MLTLLMAPVVPVSAGQAVDAGASTYEAGMLQTVFFSLLAAMPAVGAVLVLVRNRAGRALVATPARGDGLLGGLALGVQGVGSDDRPAQVEAGQQRGKGRDLVALGGHLVLAMTVWLPCNAAASKCTVVWPSVCEPRTVLPSTASPTRASSATGSAARRASQAPTSSSRASPSSGPAAGPG
ncbi:hypothetical protein MMF93_30375 [Streptomyces tubbatahanensis]|uniref:Uncharacterized protein n=1 Tax=Streptomyces tubbatahanensis TaxID=2923272 RepID=A0ABY3Y0E4_9ACTN|nr:hypothetical protein [Streptomyces tubbatahanensis]UNT00291.1 hypothetical protein MMF93_30375 [Streptomyces tubbatahanensis]